MAWELLKIQNMYSVTLVVTSRISDGDMFKMAERIMILFEVKWSVISFKTKTIEKICKKVLEYIELFLPYGRNLIFIAISIPFKEQRTTLELNWLRVCLKMYWKLHSAR